MSRLNVGAPMPTYRRLASLPVLLVTGVLLAACASAPTPPPSSAPPSGQPPSSPGPSASPDVPNPSEAVDGVSVTVEAIGGHCIQGSCDSTISIEPDGRAHQREPEARDLGVVPLELMKALIVEVEQADFAAIRSRPFTDTCPIAFDGQQFVYTFTIVSRTEQIDSCQVVVDPAHPLFVAVDAALSAVAPR